MQVDRNVERLVLTFTDPKFSAFHESTKVLHLNTQKNSLSYTFNAPLMQKDAAKLNEDNTITMAFRYVTIKASQLKSQFSSFLFKHLNILHSSDELSRSKFPNSDQHEHLTSDISWL